MLVFFNIPSVCKIKKNKYNVNDENKKGVWI